MMLEYVFLVFIVVSAVLLWDRYRRANSSRAKMLCKMEDYVDSQVISGDVLDNIKKVEEIRALGIPWYEKLVSVIGVTAFVSMTAAVVIQTYEAYEKRSEVREMERKIKGIEEKEEQINRYLDSSVEDIMNKVNEGRTIGKNEKEILGWKAENMLSKEHIAREEIARLFGIVIATKQYDIAATILDNNSELLKATTPHDRVSLAEYFYAIGNTIVLKEIISEEEAKSIDPRVAVRYFALLWAVSGRNDKYVDMLSERLRVRQNEARRKMRSYIESVKFGKEQEW